jgi:hypothetical protein
VPRYFDELRRLVSLMTRRPSKGLCIAIAGLALIAAGTSSAQARSGAPRLTALRCVPISKPACRTAVRVNIGARLVIRGRHLARGMLVTFRWPRGALKAGLRHSRIGWTARVPEGTRAGHVSVRVRGRRGGQSNRRRITVIAKRAPLPQDGLPSAFRGNGMWIWYLSRSEGGNLDAIAARAHGAGMSTVFIKSSDGSSAWGQFTRPLVLALHARGLRVCAWQFVYGAKPEAEAQVGAAAAAAGADCLVIDAESAYEGRYVAAQQYIAKLRAAVGPNYPLGLTTFPYVHYHPRMPYSVFLAPGAAQANLPQVYWKAIGASVDAVSARTVAHNRIYGVPMAPLGQAYDHPTSAELRRFRALWSGYGAGGLSWWSWQEASANTWATLAERAPAPAAASDPGWPALARGATGDEVIWLQQHLASRDGSVPIDGRFGASTETALKALQQSHNLPITGETDAATWIAALALPIRAVDWTR